MLFDYLINKMKKSIIDMSVYIYGKRSAYCLQLQSKIEALNDALGEVDEQMDLIELDKYIGVVLRSCDNCEESTKLIVYEQYNIGYV